MCIRDSLQNVCLVEAETFDINSFGGTIKVARLIGEIDATNWNSISKQIKAHITYAQLFGEMCIRDSHRRIRDQQASHPFLTSIA